MSVLTGTATDYLDCLNQLRTFLKTDATLVSLGQNWTEIETNATSHTVIDNAQTNTVDYETYMVAPGLSGSEAIYVNFQAYHNVAADIYNFRIKGAIGHLTLGGSNTFFTQPNCSPDAIIPLWNQPLTFWFIANGQRVIIVVKIATVYESGYFGKFLPYGTSGQYPYPLAIGGATGTGIAGIHDGLQPAQANMRYSDTGNGHACFFDPYNIFWLDVGNVWRVIGNFFGGQHQSLAGYDSTWPYWYADTLNIGFIETNLDGSYPLFAVRLSVQQAAIAELGELDGVFATTGFGASSESAITVSADTYYLFQNGFRTAKENYVALKWA
jgi:hypothetical protein